MGRLTDDSDLRGETRCFKDRVDAGEQLADMLFDDFEDKNVIVLAIPSGGVPVGSIVAKKLECPFDLMIVRKVALPGSEEFSFGAVTLDGEAMLNRTIVHELSLNPDDVDGAVEEARQKLRTRDEKFREGRPFPDLKGKFVIVVDDGIDSGNTMYKAVEFVKKRSPRKVISAVPTAHQNAVDLIFTRVDEVYCLNMRAAVPFNISDAYEEYPPVDDEEVVRVVGEWRR